MHTTGRLDRGDGIELAWRRQDGKSPTVVFLPGFGSDMTGEKATALAAFCTECGQAMLRFDYSGHGASGGRFEDGTISRWTDDALATIDRRTDGPLILVGSSMGGWIALLAALARRDRVAALIGIAAAPDFTETLVWAHMPEVARARLMAEGVIYAPSEYGDPLPFTRALIEDGRHRLLLNDRIPLTCPVRLLQGQRDAEVPWQTALAIAEKMESADVRVTLIKDGDHRLSRERDLTLLRETVEGLVAAGA
jgi:pimeloyl-ACP methyl ester carboxylesterase